jgi:peroxiredoxin
MPQQASDGFAPASRAPQQSYASQQHLPPRNVEPGHACPFCGAPVSPDSKFCQRCGQLSGSGRQYERYMPASELANRGSPVQMSRMTPSMEAASPGGMVKDLMSTYIPPQELPEAYMQQDPSGAYMMPQPGAAIPGFGEAFPEYQPKVKSKRREKAYPRQKGFPLGLLVAIFVVAAALVSMVIFVVSQMVATPPKPTITAADKTPPVISGLSVSSVSGSSVIIEWATDEKATSQLRLCDPNGVCTWTEPDATLVKNHSVQVNDIKLGIKYHVTVNSMDAAGNEGTQETDQTFTTTVQPTTPPPADNIPEGIGLGQRAPNFILKNLQGSDVSLNSFRGKLVMINFWRVDCAPCIAEMPHMQTVYATWSGSKQMVVLAVYITAVNESAASAQSTAGSFVDASKYTFPVLLDTIREVKTTYNISSWPRTFFLDANGVIKKIQQDSPFSSVDEIKAILNSL